MGTRRHARTGGDVRGDGGRRYARCRRGRDWGYAYRDRLFAPPFISLHDVDESVRELDRVLALGARMVLIRTGPVAGRSPADPHFDPLWARVHEAGIPVALHISTSGYEAELSRMWGENPRASHRTFTAFQWFVAFATRPITDTLAALVMHNLFGRFPDLRIVSIENGSLWVAPRRSTTPTTSRRSMTCRARG